MKKELNNSVSVSCNEGNPWESYSEIIVQSIVSTKKFEAIDEKLKVNVFFVDNDEIKNLNLKFLGNDYETDVLSFNYYEGWKNGKLIKEKNLFPGEDANLELGEIYISIPKIKSQAKENHRSFSKELSTMAIHGTLHLLGYNHEEVLEEKRMFSKTEKILKTLVLE